VNISTTSATPSATSGGSSGSDSDGGAVTGFAGDDESDTSDNAAGRGPTVAQFGNGAGLFVLLGGMVLGFAVML